MKRVALFFVSIFIMLCCRPMVVFASGDTTPPVIEVSGVPDGASFGGEVTFGFWMADEHFKDAKVNLYRTNKEILREDVTGKFISAQKQANGVLGGGTSFEKIKENDGIYTLCLSCTDAYGNESEKNVVFSVNRFGSNFVYSDYLYKVIEGGGYVSEIKEDLVIHEYNPSGILRESLLLEVTKDGVPLKDLQYVNHSLSRGEMGGFDAYEYILKKENFSEDGIYKVTISTIDAVGNVKETADFSDIVFYKDSTPPEITGIKGLEHAVIKGAAKDITFYVYDSGGIDSVSVTIDGVAQIVPQVSDIHHYEGKFTLQESDRPQDIQIEVTDKSGNATDTDASDFRPHYAFENRVTITSDFRTRMYTWIWKAGDGFLNNFQMISTLVVSKMENVLGLLLPLEFLQIFG